MYTTKSTLRSMTCIISIIFHLSLSLKFMNHCSGWNSVRSSWILWFVEQFIWATINVLEVTWSTWIFHLSSCICNLSWTCTQTKRFYKKISSIINLTKKHGKGTILQELSNVHSKETDHLNVIQNFCKQAWKCLKQLIK